VSIRKHLPLSSHLSTKFITIDTGKCQACWKCVEICPNQVLGKVMFFKHRHAHVDHAEACKGCKKCVRICPNTAIRYIYISPTREPHGDQDGCYPIVTMG